MNKVIYKYPIGGPNPTIPLMLKVLHVGVQNGEPMVWGELAVGQASVEFSDIKIFMTGVEFCSDNLMYLGTVLLGGGHLVFHVYRTI